MPPSTKRYPKAIYPHEALIRRPIIFREILHGFHDSMDTTFKLKSIPMIGGKKLDLHILYREVTKRGGYEKVNSEKKWREIENVFRKDPKMTSAPFVLMNHYFNLLFHFEQVHFFRRRGPIRTPLVPKFSHAKSDRQEGSGVPKARKPVGVIDGKFNYGYLVSMMLGFETLTGVIYHPWDEQSCWPNSRTLTTTRNLTEVDRKSIGSDPDKLMPAKKRKMARAYDSD